MKQNTVTVNIKRPIIHGKAWGPPQTPVTGLTELDARVELAFHRHRAEPRAAYYSGLRNNRFVKIDNADISLAAFKPKQYITLYRHCLADFAYCCDLNSIRIGEPARYRDPFRTKGIRKATVTGIRFAEARETFEYLIYIDTQKHPVPYSAFR